MGQINEKIPKIYFLYIVENNIEEMGKLYYNSLL